MFDRIRDLLSRYASGKVILALLAGVVLLNATVFSSMSGKIGADNSPIDLMFFYTPDKVYDMVDSYGTDLRPAYARFELSADLLYPVLYSLFLSLAVTWLFQRSFEPGSRMQRLNVLPLFAGLFDFLENFSIVAMLSVHPGRPGLLAWAATVFTMAKWSLAFISLVLILVGLATLVLRKRKPA